MNKSPKAIVQHIWDARKSKTPEPEIAAQLAGMGLSPERTAHALEMIEFSMNRAFMETMGGGHSADFDLDPFFRASLKLARRQFPPCTSVRRERLIVRSAVSAAVLVGLFAIGAIVYATIDWLRASH